MYRFGKLFVFIGVVWELSCEWVELPKLEPGSVEPERQTTAAGPSVHLIRHDMVKAPGAQVLEEVADSKQLSGGSSAGEVYDTGSGTTARPEMSKGSSNRRVVSHGNAPASTNLPPLNQGSNGLVSRCSPMNSISMFSLAAAAHAPTSNAKNSDFSWTNALADAYTSRLRWVYYLHCPKECDDMEQAFLALDLLEGSRLQPLKQQPNCMVLSLLGLHLKIDNMFHQLTSSKPFLADWNSVADHRTPTRDEIGPPEDIPYQPPSSPTYGDGLPNKSYTHLDPHIESLLLKVHQTLVSHAGQPIKQKIHYLQTLQNNLLNQIWKRSQRLWVIEGPEARSSEMVSFPSLEGALLTISFLTFAVFLIRIVRGFIQGIQGTNGTTTMVDVTPNRVRHKRDLLSSQTIEILRMMDEFHLQHSWSRRREIG